MARCAELLVAAARLRIACRIPDRSAEDIMVGRFESLGRKKKTTLTF